jgi:hypothetical protein
MVVVPTSTDTMKQAACWLVGLFFDPEDGGSMILRNVGELCRTTRHYNPYIYIFMVSTVRTSYLAKTDFFPCRCLRGLEVQCLWSHCNECHTLSLSVTFTFFVSLSLPILWVLRVVGNLLSRSVSLYKGQNIHFRSFSQGEKGRYVPTCIRTNNFWIGRLLKPSRRQCNWRVHPMIRY